MFSDPPLTNRGTLGKLFISAPFASVSSYLRTRPVKPVFAGWLQGWGHCAQISLPRTWPYFGVEMMVVTAPPTAGAVVTVVVVVNLHSLPSQPYCAHHIVFSCFLSIGP